LPNRITERSAAGTECDATKASYQYWPMYHKFLATFYFVPVFPLEGFDEEDPGFGEFAVEDFGGLLPLPPPDLLPVVLGAL